MDGGKLGLWHSAFMKKWVTVDGRGGIEKAKLETFREIRWGGRDLISMVEWSMEKWVTEEGRMGIWPLNFWIVRWVMVEGKSMEKLKFPSKVRWVMEGGNVFFCGEPYKWTLSGAYFVSFWFGGILFFIYKKNLKKIYKNYAFNF